MSPSGLVASKPASVDYDPLEQKSVDRLAFPTCETHCETFVEKDDFFTLNKPRCIMGVCSARLAGAGDSGFIGRHYKRGRREQRDKPIQNVARK
jgi:hypothetical protein